MNKSERILRLLFRIAAQPEAPAQMPFGFDTRVLASLREVPSNGSVLIALLTRRVTAIALAVIMLAGIGLYRTSVSETNTETTNEYGIVDNAIQNNFLE
jgi:hypothetical protein